MQRERVLGLAGRIENELHALGMTDARVLALLERVHQPGDLPPPGIYEQIRRDLVGHGHEDEAPRRLLELLWQLDRALIFAFDLLRAGTFESAKSADKDFETHMGRSHVTSFSSASVRYVAFQLELSHPYPREGPVTIPFDWRLDEGDGHRVHQEIETITIQAHWQSSWVAQTWGKPIAPGLVRGRYRGSAWIWGRELASCEFEIT